VVVVALVSRRDDLTREWCVTAFVRVQRVKFQELETPGFVRSGDRCYVGRRLSGYDVEIKNSMSGIATNPGSAVCSDLLFFFGVIYVFAAELCVRFTLGAL
jgi:hypothetical protein